MYQQIAENKTKTWIYIIGFIVVISGLAWLFDQVYDVTWLLPIALIVSVVQAWVGYFYSDKIALATSRAVAVEKREAPELYRLVENLTIADGIPMPGVYLIDDGSINAFATGRDPEHASIAVTRGALEKLTKPELEGVLAHELSHVKNYDIRISSIVVVLVGVLAMLANLFTRSIWWGGGRRNDRDNEGGGLLMLLGIIFALLAPLVATLIQLAISRKREYLADASGALLTRYPEGLADALEKIESDSQPMRGASQATAHLFFTNPFEGLGRRAASLFSTHPPIEDRVKRLREMNLGKRV